MKWLLALGLFTALTGAEDLDLSKYSTNARKFLSVLYQHYPGPMVPAFIKNGGKLSIISFRPAAGDDRLALYTTDQTIRLQRGADDQINWNNLGDMTHEFWHAYWDQVASRGPSGPDPETFKGFQETLAWLKKQKFDPVGSEPASPAQWDIAAGSEMTDEYIGGLVDVLTSVYTRLTLEVGRRKITTGQAQKEWDLFLTGKGVFGKFLKGVKTYRNHQENASEYQINASIADGGPALPARLAILYGLQFEKR